MDLDGLKVLKGRQLKENEFSFKLTRKATDPADPKETTTATLNVTRSNASDGSIVFGGFNYEIVSSMTASGPLVELVESYRLGTTVTELSRTNITGNTTIPYVKAYTYIIQEVTPDPSADPDGLTYDSTPREVTITVTFDETKTENKLTATKPDGLKIEFVNTYAAEGDTQFSGTKALANDSATLEAGQYTFELYEVTGTGASAVENLIDDSVTNAADGSFSFKQITYALSTNTSGKLVLTATYEGATSPFYTKTFETETALPEMTFHYRIKEFVPAMADAPEGIVYSVQTFDVTVTVTDNGDGKLNVAKVYDPDPVGFINTPEFTRIDGMKVWDDENDQDGIRPIKIEIDLMRKLKGADDSTAVKIGNTIEVTAANADPSDTTGNTWIWSVDHLPIYEPGTTESTREDHVYVYFFSEAAITYPDDFASGYSVVYTTPVYENGHWFVKITNTHIPELVDINGLKVWDDADDQDMIRPESIEITLLANDVAVTVDGNGNTITNPVTVTADANGDFKWSFTDLPRFKPGEQGADIEYSFSEATITYPNVFEAGYAVQYAKTEFQQPVVDPDTGDVTNGYWTVTVTNTHEPEAIPFSLYKYGQVAEDGQIQPDTKPLKGAVFTLYTDEACTDVAEMIVVDENGDYSKVPAIATSDEKGFVDFGQINFKLTLVTDDTVDPPVLVSVTTEAQTYYMKETLGDDLKDSYWDNTTIYEVVATPRELNADGTVKTEASVTISVLKDEPTDADGNVYTGVLTTGETIVIGETPDGLPIEVTADKIDNDLVHYEIRLVKIDHTDKTKPVVGAQFDLYRAPDTAAAPDTGTEPGTDNAAEPDDTANDDEEAPVSLTLPTVETVSGYEKLNTKTPYTGNDGKLDLGDLLLGTYYLVETAAPDGYYKLDDPVEIIVEKELITVNFRITTYKDGESTVTDVSTEYPQDPGVVPTIEVTIEDMPKYGNLTIVKHLNRFELSEDATFVFTVVGKIDGKTVYSNVATLTCSAEHPSGLLSTTLNYIPAGAEVTVTESYSGSHYVLTPTSEKDQTTVIVANDTVSVDFTNDYTPEEKGGHGIVNTFEPDDSELGWHWGGSNVSSTPDKPAALPPAPVTGDEEENSEGPEEENSGDTPEE